MKTINDWPHKFYKNKIENNKTGTYIVQMFLRKIKNETCWYAIEVHNVPEESLFKFSAALTEKISNAIYKLLLINFDNVEEIKDYEDTSPSSVFLNWQEPRRFFLLPVEITEVGYWHESYGNIDTEQAIELAGKRDTTPRKPNQSNNVAYDVAKRILLGDNINNAGWMTSFGCKTGGFPGNVYASRAAEIGKILLASADKMFDDALVYNADSYLSNLNRYTSGQIGKQTYSNAHENLTKYVDSLFRDKKESEYDLNEQLLREFDEIHNELIRDSENESQ